jgi:dTDP-glucose pyrophosphorylase
MIVSGRGNAGHFLELLGSGAGLGVKFTYEIQEEAGGIAQALSLAESFADEDDVRQSFLEIIFSRITLKRMSQALQAVPGSS